MATDAGPSNDRNGNDNGNEHSNDRSRDERGGRRDRGGWGGRGGRGGGRGGKDRKRGQNHNRQIRPSKDAVSLCKRLGDGKKCEYGDDCSYSHDVDLFMATKGEDIGPECFVFRQTGKCKFGIRCRYAGDHIKKLEDGSYENIINEEKVAAVGESLSPLNVLQQEYLSSVRKSERSETITSDAVADFSAWLDAGKKVHAAREKVDRSINAIKEAREAEARAAMTEDAPEQPRDQIKDYQETSEHSRRLKSMEENLNMEQFQAEKAILLEHDEVTRGLKSRFPAKKKIDFRGKTYLAPLTTVGNLPFRRLCKTLGVDITCGEMAVTTALVQSEKKEWALLRRHPSEDIFGVQISASNSMMAAKACDMINKNFCGGPDRSTEPTIDFVDLNCGCPIDMVTRAGAGSALLDRRPKLKEIIFAMNRTLNVPVTVKLRTGVQTEKRVAHKLIPMLRDAGAAMITMHGRSKEQRYTKTADWDYIHACAPLAGENVPFFGNGDVLSWEDYYAQMERPGTKLGGVMVGRGALIKPWIFTEIKERRVWDIRSSERLDLLKQFANFGLDHWGSDTHGVNVTRRYLLEWMSFTHRYVPVGLLEVVPQKFNDRVPLFYGRDDLETLMGSPNVADWIKLSEMVLGKCPDDFTFLPKHKSNSVDSEAGMALASTEE
ncbi:zinc finger dihydrouridine synthase [Zopfochytrium polystomum]|nr:zinc finger dihydrouridine synthase [Zopfochytrium polystomum]